MFQRTLLLILFTTTFVLTGCGGGAGGGSSNSGSSLSVSNTSNNEQTDNSSDSNIIEPAPSADLPPVGYIAVIPKVLTGKNVSANANSSYDPEGNNLTYEWSLSKPSGSNASLNNSNSASVTFTADIGGTYTLTLTVNDGEFDTTVSQSVVADEIDADPKFFAFNQGSSAISSVPFTVGQVFPQGMVQPSQNITATPDDNVSSALTQMDVKTNWPDGSVKHAVVSGIISNLAVGAAPTYELTPSAGSSSNAISLSDLLNSGFDATVELNVGGTSYSASAADLLTNANPMQWLSGPVVSEWVVLGSVETASNVAHPHLAVQFHVRAYQNNDVRVMFVVENNWSYESNPSNQTYNATLKINGITKRTLSNLPHFHHARWNSTHWNTNEPQIHIALNPSQFIQAKVLPNYDPSLIFSTAESRLQYYQDTWVSSQQNISASDNSTSFSLDKFGPMGPGLAVPYMPMTGGRPDIGPLPRWGAMYMLSQDPRAKKAAFGMGDLSGSWPIHYRDKSTGLPVSIEDYPYISTKYAKVNPATSQSELLPACSGDCATPYTADNAHQPSFGYVPYIFSGDYYYLEELHFWTNWAALNRDPHYREYGKGIIYGQIRARAWMMRKVAQSAAITPDNHPLKSYFNNILDNNLDKYIEDYVTNPQNNYGALYAYYDNPAQSPWMDDFFTWAMNHAWELGFSKAKTMLDFKAKYPVKRMGFTNTHDDSYCWIFGAPYRLMVAASASSPMYMEMEEVYPATNGVTVPNAGVVFNDKGNECNSPEMAADLGLQQGEMIGYSSSPAGFPSNMQIALAAAADSGASGAIDAWARFESRSVKPDYSDYPNYAIVPR